MKSVQFYFKSFLLFVSLVLFASNIFSQSWAPFGTGTGWGYALAVYNNELYAGGDYGISKWNGSSWESVGGGINGKVNDLCVYQGMLVAGGNFVFAGGTEIPFLAQWDGTAWSDLGSSPNSIVQTLTIWNNKLIIGGYFTQCENMPANRIIQYDGNNFSILGTGTNSQVMAVSQYGTDLYAGGFFSTAGGVSANHVAKWDGTTWSSVGGGISGIVYELNTHNGSLIAGGLFSSAGGVSANAIASWNGTAWSALGSGCSGGMYPYVFSIISFNGNLYAAGLYTIAGGQTVNGIAKWDGNSWSGLGGGFYNGGSNVYGAHASIIFNNELVATGIFNSAGGVGAGNIAKWNGLLTGVSHNNSTIPDNYSLGQNYPNPFNPSTNINFSLPKAGTVKLIIYDETGKEVSQLVNENLSAGNYSYNFNASGLSSGVYFYSLNVVETTRRVVSTETKKMLLIK